MYNVPGQMTDVSDLMCGMYINIVSPFMHVK